MTTPRPRPGTPAPHDASPGPVVPGGALPGGGAVDVPGVAAVPDVGRRTRRGATLGSRRPAPGTPGPGLLYTNPSP
ncbi:hypothetical protein AB6N23_17870, partial [Cellulomonas sp. 179-A 9B4 NHS]